LSGDADASLRSDFYFLRQQSRTLLASALIPQAADWPAIATAPEMRNPEDGDQPFPTIVIMIPG
jgi:hypothetical protein